MSRSIFKGAALLAVSLAVGALLAIPGLAQTAAPDAKGKAPVMAPNFSAQDLSGKTVRLSDFRGKKVAVVSFFATWCPPCRMEMPILQKLNRKYAGKDVAFLAVSIDAPGTDLKPFVKEFGLTFPVLHDTKSTAAKAYKVKGIPMLVLIDKQGRLIARHEGFDPKMEGNLSQKIDAALAAR
jgi:peroxiredoxin